MLAGPVLRAILLQRTMSLPGAVLCPSPLLLPRHCLLLCTLRLLLLPGLLRLLGSLLLLRLLGPLLLLLLSPLRLLLLLLRLLSPLRLLSLLRLLSPLRLRLLLFLFRLLGPLLRLLLLLFRLLGPLLLLLRLLLLLLPALLPFGSGLFLIVLRVGRVNRREKHEQGSRTDNSNQLHRNRPPLISPWSVHANGQSA